MRMVLMLVCLHTHTFLLKKIKRYAAPPHIEKKKRSDEIFYDSQFSSNFESQIIIVDNLKKHSFSSFFNNSI